MWVSEMPGQPLDCIDLHHHHQYDEPLYLSSDGAALDITHDHADVTSAESWSYEEALPAGPFSSQKMP